MQSDSIKQHYKRYDDDDDDDNNKFVTGIICILDAIGRYHYRKLVTGSSEDYSSVFFLAASEASGLESPGTSECPLLLLLLIGSLLQGLSPTRSFRWPSPLLPKQNDVRTLRSGQLIHCRRFDAVGFVWEWSGLSE